MPYREPSLPIRSVARLVWGPFGFGGPSIVAGLALFVLGVIVIGDRLETQTIACHANGCEVTTASFGRERHAVVDSSVAVSVETIPCPISSFNYERRCGVVVMQGAASTIRLVPMDLREAPRVAERLRRALASPTAGAVSLRLRKLLPFYIVIASLEVLTALFMIGSGIGRLARFDVWIDGERRRITLRRRILGLPLGSRQFEVDVVRDARVEWHDGGGRLVLDTDRGAVTLDEKFRSGWNAHRRAASALREAFDCPPRSPEVQAQLERAAEESRPRSVETGVVRALFFGLAGGAVAATVVLTICCPSDWAWSARAFGVLALCGSIMGAYASLSGRRRA